MGTLSVVVITRNEQDNLGPCLDTVPFADEIVIVDDESEDATLQIARRYTERVFERKLDRFGRQKQFAIEQASCDWILVLDADERLTPELAEEIRGVLQHDDAAVDGYFMRRRTWLHGHAVTFSGWYKCSHLRLFRRARARYVDRRVHEYPELEDPSRSAKLLHPLDHYTYACDAAFVAKLERYSRLAALDWYDTGRRAHWFTAPWYFAIVPAAAWIREYVVHKGYRGGRLGLRIATMSARADLMTARQLWRLSAESDAEREAPCSGR